MKLSKHMCSFVYAHQFRSVTSLNYQEEVMTNFRIEKPFATKSPRLKDLVNEHIMGDVWIRDMPFGAVTDSRKIAEHFEMSHFVS